jgi:protoheme IX farnesyltransferase
VIIANREDYLQAGLDYFPISAEVRDVVRVLFVFSLALFAASLALYLVGGFGWLYLAAAAILGAVMIFASFRLVKSDGARDAWRVYKLSSFPYLGLLFLIMCLDIWLI